ncbi:MAG: glycoside hydrolase family 19 protein [Alphaproteobacteria bacterium]|nr:glycoside hydrolase family 19 protein [Alphaproteobacteria bacterium]
MANGIGRAAEVARIGGVRPEFVDAVDRALAATGGDPAERARFVGPLAVAAKRFAVVTRLRLAHFVAQLSHESGGFGRLEENLNYSAGRLCAVFPNRFGTPAMAERYAGRPEDLANLVYSGVNGNAGIASGDGWKYRGRGLIQLTGRVNYRAAGRALEQPLEDEPDRVTEPWTASLVAGWYWQVRGINLDADRGAGGVEAVTRAINGKYLKGLDERAVLFNKAISALAPFPDTLEV